MCPPSDFPTSLVLKRIYLSRDRICLSVLAARIFFDSSLFFLDLVWLIELNFWGGIPPKEDRKNSAEILSPAPYTWSSQVRTSHVAEDALSLNCDTRSEQGDPGELSDLSLPDRACLLVRMSCSFCGSCRRSRCPQCLRVQHKRSHPNG